MNLFILYFKELIGTYLLILLTPSLFKHLLKKIIKKSF